MTSVTHHHYRRSAAFLVAACILLSASAGKAYAEFDVSAVYYGTATHGPDADTRSGPNWPFLTFGVSQRYTSTHAGIDLTRPAGSPVRPIAPGAVTFSGSDISGYGNHVRVEHDDGISSLYAHLSRIDVQEGQIVSSDTILGGVGATGHATGNHLHLEIMKNNKPLNPFTFLPDISRDIDPSPGIVRIAPELPPLSL